MENTKTKPESSAKAEVTPAEQAAQISNKAKKFLNKLSLSEKIIGAGALASLIGFFLPWISGVPRIILEHLDVRFLNGLWLADNFGWAYLIPLLMIASLGLLYFSQGAPNISKVLLARWQIVIGSTFASLGILGIIAFSEAINLLGMGRGFGFDTPELGIGIGFWLFTSGSIAILVGALELQSKLLKK